MRKALDDFGLKLPRRLSLPLDDANELKSALSKQIEYNLEIGSKYLITPWAPVEQMKRMNNSSLSVLGIGEEVNRHGLKYAYHNHAFEFAKRDGKYLLDSDTESIDADIMLAELDLYWVKKGGIDSLWYLQSYKRSCSDYPCEGYDC